MSCLVEAVAAAAAVACRLPPIDRHPQSALEWNCTEPHLALSPHCRLLQALLSREGVPPRVQRLSLALWLFNPLTVTISTRGSGEAVVACLLLALLLLLRQGRRRSGWEPCAYRLLPAPVPHKASADSW